MIDYDNEYDWQNEPDEFLEQLKTYGDVHRLKIVEPYFGDVYIGNKTFEVRKNDRDYKVNDILILKDYIPANNSFTGDYIVAHVIYILNDSNYCKDGYVIMGIEIIDSKIELPF